MNAEQLVEAAYNEHGWEMAGYYGRDSPVGPGHVSLVSFQRAF